ncbi:MAG: hypothetical protein SPD95_10410 [Candidatus Faecousia sp.]|nr:hypothetical protein [Candidatus Faecousia sp.]
MKISIAYLPGEDQEAGAVKSFIESSIPGVKVRESDRHAPFKHIYLTTKKAEIHCSSKENP